ncbi:hypothetical protein AX774_g592 [Zancudomyces culisetae]|uniref:Uncharacterized protein n=1 Tax=Zancudomyces culisetae TaxID=1213189 RepID=A0A1R1PY53_ZANCU|nr:hypothetical protein AX774_g592 [Zancudomyces culisetae]|eukprot:OMH85847.1 hypothetical protein AX774_g592 [Zancudomyces culisetae]
MKATLFIGSLLFYTALVLGKLHCGDNSKGWVSCGKFKTRDNAVCSVNVGKAVPKNFKRIPKSSLAAWEQMLNDGSSTIEDGAIFNLKMFQGTKTGSRWIFYVDAHNYRNDTQLAKIKLKFFNLKALMKLHKTYVSTLRCGDTRLTLGAFPVKVPKKPAGKKKDTAPS